MVLRVRSPVSRVSKPDTNVRFCVMLVPSLAAALVCKPTNLMFVCRGSLEGCIVQTSLSAGELVICNLTVNS